MREASGREPRAAEDCRPLLWGAMIDAIGESRERMRWAVCGKKRCRSVEHEVSEKASEDCRPL